MLCSYKERRKGKMNKKADFQWSEVLGFVLAALIIIGIFIPFADDIIGLFWNKPDAVFTSKMERLHSEILSLRDDVQALKDKEKTGIPVLVSQQEGWIVKTFNYDEEDPRATPNKCRRQSCFCIMTEDEKTNKCFPLDGVDIKNPGILFAGEVSGPVDIRVEGEKQAGKDDVLVEIKIV